MIHPPDALGYGMSLAEKIGTWVEFGVAGGRTLRRLAEHRGAALVFGFDSFRGLPEDWRHGHLKGEFTQESIPVVEGAEIVCGLFQDVLPTWTPPSRITFAHVDCDLYSSTVVALAMLRRCMAETCIAVFDEYHGYPGAEEHEARALAESGIPFEVLAIGEHQAVMKLG